MISKGFFRSSLLFTAGGALPMVASLLLLPFYTNFLSDVNYMRLLFYISISAVSQILFSFATDTFFGVKYSQLFADESGQRDFITYTARLLLWVGVAVLSILCLFGSHLFNVIFPDEGIEFWPYGFVSVLTGFFNSYFKTASICLIYLKRPARFLTDNILNFVFTVGISLAGLYLYPDSVAGPLMGRLISGGVIFVLGSVIFSRFGSGKITDQFRKETLAFCLPYLAYGVALWTLGSIDRYFLKNNVPFQELNAYDLVLKCFLGIEFLQNSISAVIFPKVYDIYARTSNNSTSIESNRYFNAFTVLNVVVLLLFCICLPWIYSLLISKPHFFQATIYMGIIAAGHACRSIIGFYLSGILFAKKIRLMLVIFVISAIVQIALSWVLIGRYGLSGALYAGLATRLLQTALFATLAPQAFGYSFNGLKIYAIPVIFILANTIYYVLGLDYNVNFYIAQLITVTLISILLYRRELIQLRLSMQKQD